MGKEIGHLHVLTDAVLQKSFSHIELTRLAIAGGADVIQFREKVGSTRNLIETAKQLKQVCTKAGVTFIVNDRIDVAIACDSDGVHLGQDDFPIPLARKLLGSDKIIGGSARTYEEVQKCLAEGADYIGLGPIFPTGSKSDAGEAIGVEALRAIVRQTSIPIIAIGGISLDNVVEVLEAGAHGIAVISAVCCQPDPKAATAELRRLISKF